ncbi:MAG: ABC transporter permease [Acidimicrobiales bacterium]
MGRRYVLKRLLQVPPALLIILLLTFIVIHLAPGDPAGAFAGEYATVETIEMLNRQYGLDKPIWVQFARYVTNVVTGDLGESFSYARPVSTIIAERLPATLLLAGTALAVSVLLGVALGVVSSQRPSSPVDAGISGATLVSMAVPGFWVGQMAALMFGLHLGLFPVLGMSDSRITYTGWAHVADVAHHLVLPALVLALSEIALVVRLTRTGLIDQAGSGYDRTAHAKGIRPRRALVRHALPNAALPLVTVIGSRVGFLFSGALVVETVFSWPGLGSILVNAINTSDRPLVLGLVLLVGTSVILANLVTDLVYAWIDPRIRYE